MTNHEKSFVTALMKRRPSAKPSANLPRASAGHVFVKQTLNVDTDVNANVDSDVNPDVHVDEDLDVDIDQNLDAYVGRVHVIPVNYMHENVDANVGVPALRAKTASAELPRNLPQTFRGFCFSICFGIIQHYSLLYRILQCYSILHNIFHVFQYYSRLLNIIQYFEIFSIFLNTLL